MTKSALAALLALSLLLASGEPRARAAVSEDALTTAVEETAAYLQKTTPRPRFGAVGGEWAVLGLARSGCAVPQTWYDDYCAALQDLVRERKGVLHTKKYTEYSRVVLALSALGVDARDVGGYDLTAPLGDLERVAWQGVNGPIWALLALDSGGYPVPLCPSGAQQATREGYLELILKAQHADGGWSLSDASDPDLTAMALQALANYRDRAAVQQAVDAGLACLSKLQNSAGGFSSWGVANAESCAQVVTALCELGVALDDPRFVKNGSTPLDALARFRTASGGFRHSAEGREADAVATEQGFYALVAARRALRGEDSLYHMNTNAARGLPAKNAAVRAASITTLGKTFADVAAHPDRLAVETLAARAIISGKTDARFDPDANMTRAEFASIVVKSLGLTPKRNDRFSDVAANKWYAPYVGAASDFGVINGVDGGRFAPDGIITRQEAAVMLARAAQLCGMDVRSDGAALTRYQDGAGVASWARGSLAFCCQTGIFAPQGDALAPKTPVLRCEVARMLCALLDLADLL